jgi:hypothetical protein
VFYGVTVHGLATNQTKTAQVPESEMLHYLAHKCNFQTLSSVWKSSVEQSVELLQSAEREKFIKSNMPTDQV